MKNLAKVLCVAAVGFTACKQSSSDQASAVKDLSTFSGVKRTFACSTDDPAFLQQPVPANLDPRIKDAYQTVPPVVRQAAESLGDRFTISVGTGATQACAKPEFGKVGALYSCMKWQVSTGPNPTLLGVQFFIEDNAQEMSKALVGVFGFFYSQVLPHVDWRTGAWNPQNEMAGFRALKNELTKTFIRDMIVKRDDAKSQLERVMRAQFGDVNAMRQAADPFDLVQFDESVATKAVRRSSFGDYVLAHSFDSFFCNRTSKVNDEKQNSFLDMKSNFPATFATFSSSPQITTMMVAPRPVGFGLDGDANAFFGGFEPAGDVFGGGQPQSMWAVPGLAISQPSPDGQFLDMTSFTLKAAEAQANPGALPIPGNCHSHG